MVVAIIAVLSAIVFAVVGNMRMMANETRCASNMRQIGIALRAFANDNNNRLPYIAHSRPREDSWIHTLADYLEKSDDVRLSPADPMYEDKRGHRTATSYVMNDLIFLERVDPFGEPLPEFPLPSFTNIEAPGRTILAFTGRERTSMAGFSVTNDHTHAGLWTNWRRVLSDISPSLHRTGSANSDQSNGRTNYLFADGRVESITAAESKALIERGINFADPKTVWTR